MNSLEITKSLHTCVNGRYQILKVNLWSLLDHIDIHNEVPRVDYEKLSGDCVERYLNQFEPEHKLHAAFNLSVFQRSNRRYTRRGDMAILQVAG